MQLVSVLRHSLRYLQFESRTLPNLEPIPQGIQSFDAADESRYVPRSSFQRSESTGSIAETELRDDNNAQAAAMLCYGAGRVTIAKLPALLIPPKIAASLDNCKWMAGN